MYLSDGASYKTVLLSDFSDPYIQQFICHFYLDILQVPTLNSLSSLKQVTASKIELWAIQIAVLSHISGLS